MISTMKNLIRYIASLILVLGAAGFTACSSDDGDNTHYVISFAENPVMTGSGEGTYSVRIESSHPWNAVPEAGWITGVTTSGESGATLSFGVGANDSESFRDGAIRLTVPGTSYAKLLTVRQMGRGGGLTVDPNPVAFTTEGGTQEVVIYAASGWKIDAISDAWITAVRKNNSALTVTVSPNYSGSPLTGSVTLKDGEDRETYTLPVTQEFDGQLFLGASTPLGRRFAYNADGLVGSILSDEQYALDDNVQALEIAYMGIATGVMAPCRLFVFDIELADGISVAATVTDDEDASIKPTDAGLTRKQIVREQLAAMQNNRPEVTVLGGVNGDFFFGGVSVEARNNLLHGIIYRRGVCLKDTFDGGAACTVFAVLKDGTARCLTQAQYAALDKTTIRDAIGGRQQLLSNGEAVSTDATLEPRTAVGVSRDGKRVTILVIDGRRDSYSVGASYAIMSKMFRAFDIWEAINLDGGGSSTFAVRKAGSGTVTAETFETRNRPTDTTGDREVVNGLAIVKSQN